MIRLEKYDKNDNENKIVTKDLNLWFRSNHVLKNINLRIKKNAVTSIMGPSGCGKSTLIRVFNRMNDIIEGCIIRGEVFLDEEDISIDAAPSKTDSAESDGDKGGDDSLTVGNLKDLIHSSSKKELRVLKDIFHVHMDEQMDRLRCKTCGKMTKLEKHIHVIESKEDNDSELYFCDRSCLKTWAERN